MVDLKDFITLALDLRNLQCVLDDRVRVLRVLSEVPWLIVAQDIMRFE